MAAAVPCFPTDFKHQLVLYLCTKSRQNGVDPIFSFVTKKLSTTGYHDGRNGTIIDDKSAGKEASVPQLHQRQGQVHFCFVGRRIMRKM